MDIEFWCVCGNSWGKFHFSAKSFAIASHSTGDEGGCKLAFQRALYIVSHVSKIIFNTSNFPIRYENDKDCYALSAAKNRGVIESLSSANIGFQKYFSCFETNGSTSFSKWSKRSGDIRGYLWKRKKQCSIQKQPPELFYKKRCS